MYKTLIHEQLSPVVETQSISVESGPCTIPVLPQAQCIVIPVLREVVSPINIRNDDPRAITELFYKGTTRARAIATKFKSIEKRRGAQLLRSIGLGGKYPANKAYFSDSTKAGEVLDLNSFVFGESSMREKAVIPVHAAVLYSDGISTGDIHSGDRTLSVFRTGGIAEDGGNYDIETKTSSNNIFTEISVAPGVCFLQVLVLLGKRISQVGLNHLLLSIGLAGAYGGSTATTGTNIKTHIIGMFAGQFERDINAPLVSIERAKLDGSESAEEAVSRLERLYSESYPISVSSDKTSKLLKDLFKAVEQNEEALLEEYKKESVAVKALFTAWFEEPEKETKGGKKKSGNKKNKETDMDPESETGS